MPRKKSTETEETTGISTRVFHPVFGVGSALLRISEGGRPVADVIFDNGTARTILQSVLAPSDVKAPKKAPKPKARKVASATIKDTLLCETRSSDWTPEPGLDADDGLAAIA